MTFNVDAFIKDATFPIVDDLGEYHDVMWPKDAHTLVTQLVPEGSAVVDKDTMASLIQCAIFVGSFAREPRDSRPVESLAVWARGYVDQLFANQPTLTASSGPEQTSASECEYCHEVHKDSRVACPEMSRASAKDRAEPKPEPVTQGWCFEHAKPKNICGPCLSKAPVAAPAPAAKEVRPRSD